MLAAASWPRAAHAYRTLSDLPENPADVPVRWAVPEIRWQLHLDLPPELDAREVEEDVRVAFERWSRVDCSRTPRFVFAGRTREPAVSGDGIVTVQWITEGWRERGYAPNAAGKTELLMRRLPDGRAEVLDGEIFLNAEDFPWRTSGSAVGGQDVLGIVHHEGGHLLSLTHVCGDPGAPHCDSDSTFEEHVMYPVYVGPRVPSSDDTAGICFAFSPPRCDETGCPEGWACVEGACRVWCGDEICAPHETCGGLGCCSGAGCAGALAAPDGDPCTGHEECAGTVCAPGGYCTRHCVEGACPVDFECLVAEPSFCAATGGVYGDRCAAGEDCGSLLCLAGASPTAFCTRRCEGTGAACPEGHGCLAVGDHLVCGPPPGSGCAVTRGARAPSAWLAGSALWLLVAFCARRRRRT